VVATLSHPALALAGSALLRLAATLAGLCWVAVGGLEVGGVEVGGVEGRWWRVALCLAGFTVARLGVGWYTRRPAAVQARHAA
jgi:hypothetical protein